MVPASRDTIGTDGDGELAQAVERGDLAVDAAAALDVDDGKLPRVEHVAGHHHVRAPEEDERVAVGVRGGLVQHLDPSPFST
jgi:hypothetical protein